MVRLPGRRLLSPCLVAGVKAHSSTPMPCIPVSLEAGIAFRSAYLAIENGTAGGGGACWIYQQVEDGQ